MSMQRVELGYRGRPRSELGRVVARAEEILGTRIEAPGPFEDEVRLLVHMDRPVAYADGSVPAQTLILDGSDSLAAGLCEAELQQSWNCPEAKALLEGGPYDSLVVTEMMTRGLPPTERLQLFHGVLLAVLEAAPPEVLVFRHSQQVLGLSSYLDAVEEPPIIRPGSLNVRLFRIVDDEGAMLMDTRGLDEIGLVDLQWYGRDVEPGDIARTLVNAAVHMVSTDAAIADGDTLGGPGADSGWVCRRETAQVAPERFVLAMTASG